MRSAPSSAERSRAGEERRGRHRPGGGSTSLLIAALVVGVAGCPTKRTVSRHPPRPAAVAPPPPPVELGPVTLQSALESAWEGDWSGCYKRARTALSIASEDLESMELMLRCANAQRTLGEAESFVRNAYAARPRATVVRYGLGVAALLRGNLADARKTLEKLAPEAPVAAYHAAIAAQIDDDAIAADKLVAVYVKARPSDPGGRALQAEVTCSLDVVRCTPIVDAIRSVDDDEVAVARRLGAGLSAPAVVPRAILVRLAKEADALGSSAAAFADAYQLAAANREGGDPFGVLVRSPRSGRPEPGPSVDLVREARPIAQLPFITRVTREIALGDPAVTTSFARLVALFPTDLATWRLARKAEKTAVLARRELEKSGLVRWRAVAASTLVRLDESCELLGGFFWNDRGPFAISVRARCEIALDALRGRRMADARLTVPPFGVLDVEAAIDGQSAQHDAAALDALARSLAKIAPTSTLVTSALWAAGDHAGKRSHAFYLEALRQSGYDPVLARRLLRKYVDQHDLPRAKALIAPSLVEAPLDAYLCGVRGEIYLQERKVGEGMVWLTKSCLSARARRDSEVLGQTLASMAQGVSKVRDKTIRDDALRCMKGD